MKNRLHSILPISLSIETMTDLHKQYEDVDTDEDKIEDVEKGVENESNDLDAPLEHTQCELQFQVDVISTLKENQLLQDALKKSRQFVVIIERESARDGNEAQENLLPYQKFGIEIIKIWILPVSLVLIAVLFQVVTTNQGAKPTKTFSLKPYFISLMVTFVFGAILLALSVSEKNFQRKMLITKVLIVVTCTSSMVDLCLLIVLGWQLA